MSFHYFRYYVGHRGRHGLEFFEFEISSDGILKYANNSNYRKDRMIKKQCCVSSLVVEEILRLITSSGIMECDDTNWPEPDRNGRQELEIRIGNIVVSFVTNKDVALSEEIQKSKDPVGLGTMYHLVRDIKTLVLSLLAVHFKLTPV